MKCSMGGVHVNTCFDVLAHRTCGSVNAIFRKLVGRKAEWEMKDPLRERSDCCPCLNLA
jgi:hypothetical protein